MAVASAKRLPIHALPVTMVVIGLLALSAAILQGIAVKPEATKAVALKALFTPTIEVAPTSKGLGTVKLHQERPILSSGLERVGQQAGLEFSLQ